MANDQDTFHADLCELLTILGMGDHSRPQSPHEVFQEALGVLRERLSLPAPTPTPPCLGEREAMARAFYEVISGHYKNWGWHIAPLDDPNGSWWRHADAIIAQHIAPLRTENETLTAKLAQAEGEIATMRGALETIAEEHDAGRHDGLPEACPAHEAEVMWAVARAALTNPEPPHGD